MKISYCNSWSLKILLVVLYLIFPIKAQAANIYKHIVVFGDSLSDTGNLDRFSNGTIWVERLASDLGTTLDTRAWGGAAASDDHFLPWASGLQDQIDTYISNNSATSDTLYIVWAGANDYMLSQQWNPSQPYYNVSDPQIVIDGLKNSVVKLQNFGAKNILIPNMPDLGLVPFCQVLNNCSVFSNLTQQHNNLLSQQVWQDTTTFQNTNLIPFDFATTFQQIIAFPEQFGLSNVKTRCGTICNSNYFFWDDRHPTEGGHLLIEQSALQAINTNESNVISVPEHSNNWGIAVATGLQILLTVKGFLKQTKDK